ncbi:MAG: hypothetical protein FD136_1233 [Chitinophagaceae bacterium]|nr:MAG: hypothetical protein FD136_1233 [Chitinophagaceae bacterium]
MKTYHLIYSEPSKVYHLVALTSLIFIEFLLLTLYTFKVNYFIPTWVIIFCFLIVYVGIIFYLKRKILSVECEATKTDRGILIELSRTNFLYTKKEIILSINAIKQITSNTDPTTHQICYFLINFIDRANKVKLGYPKSKHPIDMTDFSNII